MKVKNLFTKGCVDDLDYSKVQPTQWVLPTVGLRIINKKGKGLIATNIRSNEEAFSFGSDMRLLGANEYNGIAYFVLHNVVTGQGECGSYPSPKIHSIPNTEFVREYKPFWNFKGIRGTKPPLNLELRTTLFNFTDSTYCDVEIREVYDGSVNLYITDDNNPIRVVNSNFNQQGNLLDRYYYTDSFNGAMNMIASTTSPMLSELTSVEAGGNHKPGNYFYFFRYLTEDFNGTHFIESLGPVAMFENIQGNKVEGKQERQWLTNTSNYVNKKVLLSLSNLDQSYKFLQIGVLRYSAIVENGLADKNVYYIDKYYRINGATKDIVITGQESQGTLTFDDLIARRIPYNRNCRHVITNNIYYGASWRKSELNYDNDKFAEAALLITCNPVLSENLIAGASLDNQGMAMFEGGWANAGFYKRTENTYDYVGYMRNEAYPFGIKYLFDDGTETDVFPVKGNVRGTLNDKGIYKFTGWDDPLVNDPTKALGIRFSINNFNTYIQNNTENFRNIIGYKFVRGERIDNFICQGVLMHTYDRIEFVRGGGDMGLGQGNSGYDETQALSFPVYSGFIPTAFQNGSGQPTSYYTAANVNIVPTITHRSSRNMKKVALFSSDLILDSNKNADGNLYMKYAFTMGGKEYDTLDLALESSIVGYENDATLNFYAAYMSTLSKEISATTVNTFTNRAGNNFSSYIPGRQAYYVASGATGNGSFNRSYSTSKYIGIVNNIDFPEIDTFYTGGTQQFVYNVVNLYKNEPTPDFFSSAVNAYNVATSTYEAISGFVNINASGTQDCYKGDTFLQKSFYRTHRFWNYDYANSNSSPPFSGDGREFIGANDRWYQAGFLLGLMTENLINADLRNRVEAYDDENNKVSYNFFPRCIEEYTNLKQWVVLRDINAAVVEALQVNDGYNQTQDGKQSVGFDENISSEADNTRLQRIYHSNKQVPGAIIDNLRTIGNNYIDLDTAGGKINGLIGFEDFLISIQENIINQHPIKERVTNTDSATGTIVLASSVSYLPEYYKKLTQYGSQHKFSIIQAEGGVYGYDWRKAIWWKIVSQVTQAGNSYLQVVDLGKQFFFSKVFEDIRQEYSGNDNDIMSIFPDTPLLSQGIVSGYNEKFDEVYLTFLNRSNSVTLCFNDRGNLFMGKMPFTPYAYFKLNDGVFSLRRGPFARGENTKAYRHDRLNHYQEFYGTKEAFQLSFIVNGLREEESMEDLEKIFESLHIEMPKERMTTIIYETESQYSTYAFVDDTDDDQFWLHSEYSENEWIVPVYIQTQTKSKDYDTGSDVRGHWCKVTLTYDPGNIGEDALEIYITKVITDFVISNS